MDNTGKNHTSGRKLSLLSALIYEKVGVGAGVRCVHLIPALGRKQKDQAVKKKVLVNIMKCSRSS